MVKIAIAGFGGAEFFPGARLANQRFRQFLAAHRDPDWEILWEPSEKQLSLLDCGCVAIGFSYGAVRVAVLQTPQVVAKVLVDGWCVWTSDRVPVFRLSHDWITHLNALAFGGGQQLFCADPAVEHLQLWKNPQVVLGWVEGDRETKLSAADFLLSTIRENAIGHPLQIPEPQVSQGSLRS